MHVFSVIIGVYQSGTAENLELTPPVVSVAISSLNSSLSRRQLYRLSKYCIQYGIMHVIQI